MAEVTVDRNKVCWEVDGNMKKLPSLKPLVKFDKMLFVCRIDRTGIRCGHCLKGLMFEERCRVCKAQRMWKKKDTDSFYYAN